MSEIIDLKDKKILFELDKNARIGLPELSRKVKLSREAVFYRLNKLIDNKFVLRFHTVVASYRFGLVAYKVYLRLSDIDKEHFGALVDYLMQDKDVFWIGISKGRWDLMFGIWARDMEEFFAVHDRIMERFNKYTQDKELSISRFNYQFNRRWLYYDKLEPVVFDFGETDSKLQLEDEDARILNVLAQNSRTKAVDVARETGISAEMVSYRIKKMEKNRVIKGYKCLFNATKLGFVTCKAFVYFKNVNETKKRSFIEYCKMIPQCINVIVTFAPWDMEIMFEVDDFEHFYNIMEEAKERFGDIMKFYDGLLITSEPKQVFVK